jgi:hypothetical protein
VATGRALLDRRSDTAQGDWGWSLCIRFLPSPPLITCCCPCAQAEHKPEALVKAKAHKELMLRSTVLAAPLALVPVLPDLAFRGPKGILQPIVRSPHPPRLPLVQDACCGAMRWLCEAIHWILRGDAIAAPAERQAAAHPQLRLSRRNCVHPPSQHHSRRAQHPRARRFLSSAHLVVRGRDGHTGGHADAAGAAGRACALGCVPFPLLYQHGA